jgi:hypothetical protein
MVEPDTDRGLRHTAGRQLETGSRLLLAGGVLFAVGLVLMLATDGFGDFLGVALSALATPPTLAGLALCASGLVSRRASEQRPFA